MEALFAQSINMAASAEYKSKKDVYIYLLRFNTDQIDRNFTSYLYSYMRLCLVNLLLRTYLASSRMEHFNSQYGINKAAYMSNNDTEEERFFRERYAQELQKIKKGGYRQNDDLAEERRRVNQQEGKTPGRRGEEIKQEEINKEIVRRERLKQQNK
jgi:hypothetical protein